MLTLIPASMVVSSAATGEVAAMGVLIYVVPTLPNTRRDIPPLTSEYELLPRTHIEHASSLQILLWGLGWVYMWFHADALDVIEPDQRCECS
jgi:hypothetical protein